MVTDVDLIKPKPSRLKMKNGVLPALILTFSPGEKEWQ